MSMLLQLQTFQLSNSRDLLTAGGWISLRKQSILMALQEYWDELAPPGAGHRKKKFAHGRGNRSWVDGIKTLLDVTRLAHSDGDMDMLAFLLYEALTPIVSKMSASVALSKICVGSGPEREIILHLETKLSQFYGACLEPENLFKGFCLLFIKKKLQMQDRMPGYAIALKELLEANPKARRNRFFLFASIIHGPISSVDQQWVASLVDCDEDGYEQHVTSNPFLLSERHYVSMISEPAVAVAVGDNDVEISIIDNISTIGVPDASNRLRNAAWMEVYGGGSGAGKSARV